MPARSSPDEPIREIKLRLPASRVALADADRARLRMTRNGYIAHLIGMQGARDRHEIAEMIGALHYLLWDIARLGQLGTLDPAETARLVAAVEGASRAIIRRLRQVG